MKQNFNLKNIKNVSTKMFKYAMDDDNPITMEDYIKLFDAFHEMYVFGFLSYDEWGKIFEHDKKLFNGEI